MDRHEVAKKAIDGQKAAHQATPYPGSERECLIVTLENLMHWAAAERIEFEECRAAAVKRFSERLR